MVRAWSVTARGQASVKVRGRNWIVALGRGLDELGRADALQRLACEVLPNGTVIARDIASGAGFVVQQMEADEADAVGQVGQSQQGLAPIPITNGLDELPDDQTSELPMPVDPEDETPPPRPAVRADDGGAVPGANHEPDRAAWSDDEPSEEDQEELQAESIYELPADAIAEPIPDDDPGLPILDASTRLDACRMALGRAREAVGAESGAVILAERGTLRFVAVDGPSAPKLIGNRLPIGTGVAGFAMERRRSIVLPDARTDPRHCGEVDAMTGYVTREIAVLPLVFGDRALGVLELMNLPEGRRFGEREMASVQPLADALAVRLGR